MVLIREHKKFELFILDFNCFVWELILSDVAHSPDYYDIHQYGFELRMGQFGLWLCLCIQHNGSL